MDEMGCFIAAYLTSHLPFVGQKPMEVGIQESNGSAMLQYDRGSFQDPNNW